MLELYHGVSLGTRTWSRLMEFCNSSFSFEFVARVIPCDEATSYLFKLLDIITLINIHTSLSASRTPTWVPVYV